MPPENLVPQSINPDSLPSVGENQQAPSSQYPPFNAPQDTTHPAPPNKPFPIVKIAIGIGVLIIVIGLSGAGYFFFQKSRHIESTQSKSEVNINTSPVNESTQQTSSGSTINDLQRDIFSLIGKKYSILIPQDFEKKVTSSNPGKTETVLFTIKGLYDPKSEARNAKKITYISVGTLTFDDFKRPGVDLNKLGNCSTIVSDKPETFEITISDLNKVATVCKYKNGLYQLMFFTDDIFISIEISGDPEYILSEEGLAKVKKIASSFSIEK